MTAPDAPPQGWVACDTYPAPGETIMLWCPATSSFETGVWVPATLKRRRIRGAPLLVVVPTGGAGYSRPIGSAHISHLARPGGTS